MYSHYSLSTKKQKSVQENRNRLLEQENRNNIIKIQRSTLNNKKEFLGELENIRLEELYEYLVRNINIINAIDRMRKFNKNVTLLDLIDLR